MTIQDQSESEYATCDHADYCTDEHCKQHSGNTTNINALLERVGDLERRDSEVDRLVGKVNLLITLNVALLLFISGELGYSFISNNITSEKYNNDKISVVTSIHEIEKKFTKLMIDLSKSFDERMDTFEKQIIINNERLNHIEENKKSNSDTNGK